MANFDKDDLGNEMRPERGYPSEVQNKAPVWIAGIVIVVAIIGVVAYESRKSAHSSHYRANPRRVATACGP